MVDRGLVYIGVDFKKFTNGRYYPFISNVVMHYCIKDNCGNTKIYAYDDVWFKNNFKVMKKKEYILWSRSVKLRKLNLI
jgi:hypothetical protein